MQTISSLGESRIIKEEDWIKVMIISLLFIKSSRLKDIGEVNINSSFSSFSIR